MNQVLTPLESQTVKQYGEHLEVVVLLVTDHVNHAVNGVILETQLCGTYILSHVNRCAVTAKQQFLVQSVLGQIGPNGAVLLAEEEALLQTLHNGFLTLQIGL